MHYNKHTHIKLHTHTQTMANLSSRPTV